MTRPLQVLHLGKYYPPAPGGIESLVRDMAVGQVQAGLDVTVHVFQHRKGEPTVREVDRGVKITRHACRANFAKLDISSDLIDHIRQARPDIIHVHVPNPSMILALLAARDLTRDVPIVVGYHADVVRQKLRSLLFRPIEHRFYRRVSAITTPSPAHGQNSRVLKPYMGRIRMVPLALNLDPYLNPSPDDLETAEQLRQSCDGPIWLACGRLVYYKGFMTAIAALARTTSGGQLWIIGTGPDRLKLEAEAARLGVSDRVKFLGHVARTVPYYHVADAFWFPSNVRSESFGLAQVEAMASGCPVINTLIPHSGVPWVSQHEQTGLSVPVGDHEALAIAADQLARHPELRSRYGDAARGRAVDQFEIGGMVRRLNALYEDVFRGAASGVTVETRPEKPAILVS